MSDRVGPAHGNKPNYLFGEALLMSQIMLVPLDGSPASEQALPYAQRIARATLAHVVLVRAAQAFTVPGMDPTETQLAAIAEAQAYLDEQAARLSTIAASAASSR